MHFLADIWQIPFMHPDSFCLWVSVGTGGSTVGNAGISPVLQQELKRNMGECQFHFPPNLKEFCPSITPSSTNCRAELWRLYYYYYFKLLFLIFCFSCPTTPEECFQVTNPGYFCWTQSESLQIIIITEKGTVTLAHSVLQGGQPVCPSSAVSDAL